MVRGVRKGGVGGNFRGGRKVRDVARCRATLFLVAFDTHAFAVGRTFTLGLLINDLHRLTGRKRGSRPADQIWIDTRANEVRYERSNVAHDR